MKTIPLAIGGVLSLSEKSPLAIRVPLVSLSSDLDSPLVLWEDEDVEVGANFEMVLKELSSNEGWTVEGVLWTFEGVLWTGLLSE